MRHCLTIAKLDDLGDDQVSMAGAALVLLAGTRNVNVVQLVYTLPAPTSSQTLDGTNHGNSCMHRKAIAPSSSRQDSMSVHTYHRILEPFSLRWNTRPIDRESATMCVHALPRVLNVDLWTQQGALALFFTFSTLPWPTLRCNRYGKLARPITCRSLWQNFLKKRCVGAAGWKRCQILEMTRTDLALLFQKIYGKRSKHQRVHIIPFNLKCVYYSMSDCSEIL